MMHREPSSSGGDPTSETLRHSYRPLLATDVPQVQRLLERERPGIAGLRSPSIYRAVLDECLRSSSVLCLVATRRDDVLGYVLAVRSWRRFQWTFLLRHPLLTTRSVVDKLRSRTLSAERGPALSPDAGTRAKTRRSARILYVGVDPRARSLGIGSGLYTALRAQLEAAGIDQIEAHIAQHNLPSVRLHERTGWSIVERPGGFLATLKLKK
jgi:ribosomal protein S18 acetylase RimI-like enzyme